MKRKKQTPEFQITPKGLILITLLNETITQQVLDALELYMRRTGNNAIVLHDNELHFEKAVFVRGHKK